MLAQSGYDFVYPVYRYASSGLRAFPLPEVLVRLHSRASADAFAQRNGLTLLRPIRFAEDQYLFSHDPSLSPFDVSNRLWEDDEVVWANPNLIKQIKPRSRPNDPLYPMQWHLNNTGQAGGVAGADIRAEEAWALLNPDPNLVIAVFDTGVDWDHPDLNLFVNEAEANGITGVDDDGNGYIDDIHGWNFMTGDNTSFENPWDQHGTAVAGLAAAIANNRIGVAGAAPGVRILPIAILDEFQGDEEDYELSESLAIAEAFRYAAQYADIMNNSWGGVISDAEYDAIAYAASAQGKRGDKRIPILFASGNDASESVTVFHDMVLPKGDNVLRFVYDKGPSLRDDDFVSIHEALITLPREATFFELPFSGSAEESNTYFAEEWFEDIQPGEHLLEIRYSRHSSSSDDYNEVRIGDISIDFWGDDDFEFISLFDYNGAFHEGVWVTGDVPFEIQILDDDWGWYEAVAEDLAPGEYSHLGWVFEAPDFVTDMTLTISFTAAMDKGLDFLHVYLNGEEITGTYELYDFGSHLVILFDYEGELHESVEFGGDRPFTFEIDDSPTALDYMDRAYLLRSGAIGAGQTSELSFTIHVEEEFYVSKLILEFSADIEESISFFRVFLNDEEQSGTIYSRFPSHEFVYPFTGDSRRVYSLLSGHNFHPDVISIGAATPSDTRANYSQWGPNLLFVAPGSGDIVTTDNTKLDPDWFFEEEFGYTFEFSGTSAACPIASGVFAMMMSAYPEIAVEQILEIGKETSAKIGGVQYDETGFHVEYGYGRLDMAAAVRRALELRDTAVSSWELYE